MVLSVSFSCRISPRTSTVILRLKSPFAIAVATSAMLRTCAVRLPAMKFTESVKSLQTPQTPFTTAWPARFPPRPTSSAPPPRSRHFARKGAELIHHRVDRVFQLQNFAQNVHRDLAGQIAARH